MHIRHFRHLNFGGQETVGGYPFRISILRSSSTATAEDERPQVYTRGFLRRRVKKSAGVRKSRISIHLSV